MDFFDGGDGNLEEMKTETKEREFQGVSHPENRECYGCEHNGDGHCRFQCKK